jgi:L,D-peptidoglycan transpeptidase YkuD (ErfK/YbiS/YcfS/YnhG family)
MALRHTCSILLLAALITGFNAAFPSDIHATSQETAPCAKLSAHQTRYSAGSATRVVFVTAAEAAQSAVLITGCVRSGDGYVQEWQQSGFIGKNGFAPAGQLRERQYRSPTGSFSVTEALGRADPGTRLLYHTVYPRSRWGGPGSPAYNNYVEGGSAADENLWYWMNQGTYQQAAVINYNRLPDATPVRGADYAIFFGAGNRVSAGCVSTTLATSTRVVQTLAPGDRFIMGVVSDVFLTAPPSAPASVPSPAPAPPAVSRPQAMPTPTVSAPAASPAANTGGSSLVTLGLLLVVGGATAVATSLVLRKHGRANGPDP